MFFLAELVNFLSIKQIMPKNFLKFSISKFKSLAIQEPNMIWLCYCFGIISFHSPPCLPIFIPFQLHRPLCGYLNMLGTSLPQGICTCCSRNLKCCSFRYVHDPFLILLESLLKYHVTKVAFLTT